MNLGPTEVLLIFLVLVLLFGAKKLPELARGSGRALRIFKAETKGLIDDDDESDAQRPTGRPAEDSELPELEQRRLESERIDPKRPDRPMRQPEADAPRDTDR